MIPQDRDGFTPGKLWSLWEVLELEVGRLVQLHERLTIDKGLYERGHRELTRAGAGHVHLEPKELLVLSDAVSEVERIARAAALTATQQAAATTKGFLAQIPFDRADFSGIDMDASSCFTMFRHLSDISSRMRDDCLARLYFQADAADAALYRPNSPLFGDEVNEVFPLAIDDIAKAGECLALGQGTATVFHLMRVMEAGFQGIARELGIAYAPSWESYINKIKPILDSANYANLTPDQKAKRPFYNDVLADLTAVKLVWRNPTMHIVKSYDVEQARVIFGSVKSFMQHLAANLDPIPFVVISTGSTSP